MSNVPETTIEAETDYDYNYSYGYDYGILDDVLRTIALASAETTATTTATGEATATSTANATTAATTIATGDGATVATADAQTSASTTATSATSATTTATATTAATTAVTDATTPRSEVEWQVTRDGNEIEDAVFDVDPIVDTANPFGDYAVIKLDDRGGEIFDEYERGTRVDVAVSENRGISYRDRFTGYVVERRENEQSGADVLEVEAYSFDQFLRRNTVTNNQRGVLLSDAIKDIITTDTPVTYNAANVEVGDEQELTRSYQGVPVEDALRDFAFKSNSEEIGVNDDLQFFFRPRETEHIDRGIDNTQWFNYDIPELGKEAINEVEVWFDDGDRSVIVDDGTDKLDLQDNLGLPDPGTQRAELQRPLITDINDAEDIGRKYLRFRNATLSGTVTTFGLFNAEPGDTIDITIDPRGIDAEFVIAAIEYRWGRDETILTIVEKRGDVDDILADLSESVQRQEMEGANRDGTKNRITTTNATATVAVTADADGTTPDADRFVNAGRNAVRDAWTGDTPPDVTTLVVGDSDAGLSRSNTALASQTNSATVSQSLPDATSVEFSASITQMDVQEIGLKAADGTLITRGTFDSAVDLNGTVTVTLSVSNDDSVSRGVLTEDGQTAIRDILADNSPAIPTDYAYGSDGSAVAETDTALGNELVSVSLDDVLIQFADTTAEWDSIVDAPNDQPVTTDGGAYALQESAHWIEGTDYQSSDGTDVFVSQEFSGNSPDDCFGSATLLQNVGETVTYEFTTPYEWPAGDWDVEVRYAGEVAGIELEVRLDGNTGTGVSGGTGGSADDLFWFGAFGSDENDAAIAAGTYSVEVEMVANPNNGNAWIDSIAPYDTRFSYTFDNSVTCVNGTNYLDGPERFPDAVLADLATAATRRPVTEASFDLTANDTSGAFFVELANDGSTFTRVSNSATGSVTFAGPERGVDSRLQISRFGSRSEGTPREGFNGQSVDEWNLRADPDAVVTDGIGEALARGNVTPGAITGETVREAGLKSGSTLLTRHELAEFTVGANERLTSAETTRFGSDN